MLSFPFQCSRVLYTNKFVFFRVRGTIAAACLHPWVRHKLFISPNRGDESGARVKAFLMLRRQTIADEKQRRALTCMRQTNSRRRLDVPSYLQNENVRKVRHTSGTSAMKHVVTSLRALAGIMKRRRHIFPSPPVLAWINWIISHAELITPTPNTLSGTYTIQVRPPISALWNQEFYEIRDMYAAYMTKISSTPRSPAK